MDADCLIKLTKAGLKEPVCAVWNITIPELVRRETVERRPFFPTRSASARTSRKDVSRYETLQAPRQTEKMRHCTCSGKAAST